MDIRELVEASFSAPQKCRGHCDQQATMRFLAGKEPLMVAFACPEGYVSKLMAYGPAPTGNALLTLLQGAGGGLPLKEGDIRTATRHSWDLGLGGAEFRSAYWTQNYRASESKDAGRPSLFLCTNCGAAYVKQLNAPGKTCGSCAGGRVR